jgi:hypothetical protein
MARQKVKGCLDCGGPLGWKPRKIAVRWRCRSCQHERDAKLTADRRAEQIPQSLCRGCGAVFRRAGGKRGRPSNWCDGCRAEQKQPKQRQCVICEKPFLAKRNQKTCSLDCARKNNTLLTENGPAKIATKLAYYSNPANIEKHCSRIVRLFWKGQALSPTQISIRAGTKKDHRDQRATWLRMTVYKLSLR